MSAEPKVAGRVALLQAVPPGELLIHELYRSLQGESRYAGLPCVFVRTTGCSLRCTWCDTPYAFTRGERMSRTDVVTKALAFDTPLIEITGGEPLEQPEVLPLMAALCDAGKTVLLETSGALDISKVDRRVHVIMDLKCPDSGECGRNLWANLDHLKPSDEIKFVIASERDWRWAEAIIRERRLDLRFGVLASGVFGVNLADLAAWVLASRLTVRMQLQMHKYVWEPNTRGV
ncbi:radical SAM protein [Limnoglobus roseus]|uniref:7-carboxy-7-deazaguanine synthase n=2 Tax=Limnoglobus roseus TaxID=2598579 RepID=A0A5C1AC16_9BACT|nr:radical SAM protein [Limnoglobus roseus]